MRFNAGIAVFVLSVCPFVAQAGDLNPPPGPVRSTMNSLAAIEPRICLNDLPGDEGATVLVTEPGNYFLREDLEGEAGKHGVRIVAQGDVAIDMSGCRIWGAQGTLDGINMELPPGGPPVSLTVTFSRDGDLGRITNWGRDGIRTDNVTTCLCSHLLVENNGGDGIVHFAAENIVHRDIATRNNLGDGTRICIGRVPGQSSGHRGHRFFSCVSDGNGGSGFNIECPLNRFEVEFDECSSNSNAGDGILVSVSTAASAPGAGSNGQGVCHFGRCFCLSNGAIGVRVEMPLNSNTAVSATELSCIGNGGDGFSVGPDVAGGIHRGHVTVLKLSEFSGNGGDGITSRNPLFVSGTTAKGNALAGMHVNGPSVTELIARIEDCTLLRNNVNGVQIDRGFFIGDNCAISDTTGSGIDCLDGCVTLQGCTISRSTLCGVHVIGTLNATDSVFRRNDEAGCKTIGGACIAENVVCELNGVGAVFEDCTSVTMTRCVFNDNTGVGVQNRSLVGPVRWMSPECAASGNGSHGFDLDDINGGSLSRCEAIGNGGAGFLLSNKANRCHVEHCLAAENLGGEFSVNGGGNMIVRCRATANAVGSFNIVAGNLRPPVVDATTIQSNTNPDANIVY